MGLGVLHSIATKDLQNQMKSQIGNMRFRFPIAQNQSLAELEIQIFIDFVGTKKNFISNQKRICERFSILVRSITVVEFGLTIDSSECMRADLAHFILI